MQIPLATESRDDYLDDQSSDANYRKSDIDSEKVRMAVKENVHLQMDFDEENEQEENLFEDAYEDLNHSDAEPEILTMESKPIQEAFSSLKHAMQLNGLRFEDLDQFLFGPDYKPEQRVLLSELILIFQNQLKLPQK